MTRRFFSGARTTPGIFATYGAAVAALSLAGWLAATPAAAIRSRAMSTVAEQVPAPRAHHRARRDDDVCRALPPIAAPAPLAAPTPASAPIASCAAPAGVAP